jgi:hypothetical protein
MTSPLAPVLLIEVEVGWSVWLSQRSYYPAVPVFDTGSQFEKENKQGRSRTFMAERRLVGHAHIISHEMDPFSSMQRSVGGHHKRNGRLLAPHGEALETRNYDEYKSTYNGQKSLCSSRGPPCAAKQLVFPATVVSGLIDQSGIRSRHELVFSVINIVRIITAKLCTFNRRRIRKYTSRGIRW